MSERQPKLGTTPEGRPIYWSMERLIETRALIQANSGGGKSYAARGLLEQTHGLVQHLVLDPEGEFSLGLIEYPSKGLAVAKDFLFLD